MKLCTASETLSFIRELEEKEAKFLEEMARRFPEKEEDFNNLAKENRKFNKQIQMAYQSVITDAIEGCFAFDLETEDYIFEDPMTDNLSLSEAVDQALVMEEKILACYDKGAEQSGSLLADVPRNFKIVARKRRGRFEKIQDLK
jgi:hypothetical protein